MRIIKITTALILSAVVSTSVAKTNDWVQEKNDSKHDIQVYTRVIDGSALKEFKGVTKIKTSLTSLAALVDDREQGHTWIQDCKSLSTLEKISPAETISYLVTAAPWPVKDRDTVIHSQIEQNPEDLLVMIKMEAMKDVAPTEKGRVRVTEMTGFWQFKPLADGVVEVTYQVHADPAGSLPNWLINSLVVDMPYHTLKNMQTKVFEPAYQAAQLSTVVNAQ